MSDFEDDSLPQEDSEEIKETLEYEAMFFEVLSGTINVEVVDIEDVSENLTKNEIDQVIKECKKQGLRVLYRVPKKHIATIFDPHTGLVGVVPTTNAEGFYC
jgi:hypothetical protein